MTRQRLRCAIYTRKSSEEGLEQEFNSLDAQREACSAYILSQASLGWTLIADRYDDPGISGGTMERPALQRLLADLQAKRIDVVVVYKIDRLTRSLTDFARIVEVFDGAGASFVSVTQQFNTTTSMGRLTLNVLLSFAQFEREVTAERIRDKIAASKKKGIWMGGTVPLGYQVVARKLIAREPEAGFIRHLFSRYSELKSVPKLAREINGGVGASSTDAAAGSGAVTDVQQPDAAEYAHIEPQTSDGSSPYLRKVTAGQLYRLLSNPAYIGKLRHKDEVHDGEHQGIVDPELFDRVQQILAANAVRSRKETRTVESRHPLNGLIFDETGDRLSPSHSTSNGRRYEYYVSSRNLAKNGGAKDGWRLPAASLHDAVLSTMRAYLMDAPRLAQTMSDALSSDQQAKLIDRAAAFADGMLADTHTASIDWRSIRSFVHRIDVGHEALGCAIDQKKLVACLGHDLSDQAELASASDAPDNISIITLSTPWQMKRRGQEARIVMPSSSGARQKPDPALVDLVARAHLYLETLITTPSPSIAAVADQYGVHPAEVSRILPLAFLAPSITEAILTGRQPAELTGRRLSRIDLPIAWAEQRALLEA
jgi:site-specific DNA recombinase